MKPKLRSFLLAGSTLLAASSLHAATLTWDNNGSTALQTDGAGAWDTALELKWWNGSTNVDWTSGDNAIFGNGGAGGAVSLASPTAVGSLTLNYFTGTYALGTSAQTITLNGGITKNAGSGAVNMILSPLILGANQTWTNNSATNLTVKGVNIDITGVNLTISGTGTTDLGDSPATTGKITGAGGIIKNGTGTLVMSAGGTSPAHDFTGGLTVNGGRVAFQSSTFLGNGSTTLNGGYLAGRFGSGKTWSGLGTVANEIRITGGESGFSGEGTSGSTFQIGSALSTLTWGVTNFDPTVLILGGAGANANGVGSLNNAIDLNGSNRTITSTHATDTAAGSGFSVSGAITNGTGTAGLTKTGVGNISLLGVNTYNGSTSINAGSITLRTTGTITGTSALNLGGGTLRLVNTANTQRFADVAVSVTAGGAISYENTNTAAITYTETLGAVTVSGGLLNVVQNTNQSTSNGQTLTFGTAGTGNLAQSGTGSVAFSAATTGPQASGNKNMFVIFGAGTTTAGQIVGPWATVGTAANAQTDYAAYNADYVVPAAIAGSAETTWLLAADPYTMDFSSAGTTLTATRNVGALRIIGGAPLTSVDIGTETITLTGHTFVDGNTVVFGPGAPAGLTVGTTYFVITSAPNTFQVSATNGGAAINLTSTGTSPTVIPSTATTLALSTGNNLGTHGILNGSPYAISITPGTGGTVTLPTTSAGQLHVNTGSNAITISAPVTDNTGALTLVKNGSAGTLILSAANNTYTGDTIINSGTLQVGVSGSNAQLNSGSYAGNIFIARGSALTLQGNSSNTLSGVISGDGNLNLNRGTTTLSGANTYTGVTSMSLVATNALGSTLNVSSFNSVVGGTASSSLGAPTTVANGTIGFGGGGIQQTAQINYTGSGETTDRIINFQFNGTGTRVIDSTATGLGVLKFTSAPISNGATTSSVTLQGTGNGEFVGGLPFAFTNFTKNGAGTWTLGGAVGNTGTTTISAGTLILNGTKYGTGTVAVNGTSTLGGSGTIAGIVTVAAGANLTPGTSVGTLTFRNDLNISALAGAANAGKLNYELGPIASSDKIVVAGTLNIGTALLRFSDFNFSALGGLQNGTYKLITSGAAVGGTLDTTPANLTGTVGAGSGTLQITGNDLELVVSGIGGGITFTDWKTANGAGAQTLADDHDGDGVDNGTEYFLFGSGNSTGFTALPGVTNTLGTLSVTWVKAATYAGAYTTDYVVETSATLAAPWAVIATSVTPNVANTVHISGNNVTYTFPAGTKNFARLKVTGP